MNNVTFELRPPIGLVRINRPKVRNAVDRQTAEELVETFRRFDADPTCLSLAEVLAAFPQGEGRHGER